MTKYVVVNALSLNMIEGDASLIVQGMSIQQVLEALAKNEWESAIGHATTAAVVSGILGVDIPYNRVNVELVGNMALVVAQYSGPRLPEGATTLPEGARIVFRQVVLEEYPMRKIPLVSAETLTKIHGLG